VQPNKRPYLGEFVNAKDAVHFDMLEHSDIQQISQTRLKMTIEVGVLKNAVRVVAEDVEMPVESPQLLGCLVRSVFLDEGGADGEHHHHDNHGRGAYVPDEIRYHR
jgi:hypothetical protein